MIGDAAAARDIEETRKAASDSPFRSTYHLKDAEEKGKYLEGVITIERDRQGRPTGIRGVVRDITESRSLLEEALRESEERYRRLVELSPEAIVVHSEGKFVYVNPAAVRLLGSISSGGIDRPQHTLTLFILTTENIVKRRVRRR